MSDTEWLANRFQENRAHLRSVAFRMLGSTSEADDAVQEVWLRLSRSDTNEIDNLGGWLTTVVARVCLDMLRSRKSRREQLLDQGEPEPRAILPGTSDPEGEMVLADSVGTALLIVLETLAPPERVAFVLHDMFDVPFDEIAPIVGRSPEAARQLASRGRRRVRGGAGPEVDIARDRRVVNAFFAASREGDFEALLSVLAPEVVLHADDVAVRVAAANKWGGSPSLSSEVSGPSAVADTFKGRARGTTEAIINGHPGAVWVVGGKPRAAFLFTVEEGQITEIDLVMAPARLSALDIELAGA